jgi:hypothetical protein
LSVNSFLTTVATVLIAHSGSPAPGNTDADARSQQSQWNDPARACS